MVETFEVPMTWLVVGASGQLGKSVCEVLGARGIDFVTWNREHGSISVENFVNSHIGQIKPNVIVNCAAWTDVDGAEANEVAAHLVNVQAVGNLAKAAKSCAAVFVNISTDYVFSGSSDQPWGESEQKQPLSAYGRSKAEGEELIFQIYPGRSYIFRTAWLYSKYGTNFAKVMVRLALMDSSPVKVVEDQIGQPTSAADLAEQIVESVRKDISFGIYHATNSGQASWFEFAQEIFRLLGQDCSRVQPVSSSEFARPAKRPSYSVLGHDRWRNSGMNEMRDWKIALDEAMPSIVLTVKAEG